VCYVETQQEAREICAEGPANKALDAGNEYRHLSLHNQLAQLVGMKPENIFAKNLCSLKIMSFQQLKNEI